MQPSRSSRANASSAPAHSLRPGALRCARHIRASAAQTLTMCNGVLRRPRSKAPRSALPSTATTPVRVSLLALAKPVMKRRNAFSKASGSSRRNTRLKVSWLGMPCSSRSNTRKSPSLLWPNSAISAQLSAPHSVAANAMIRTSQRSCRALSARGSGNRRKTFLKAFIRHLPMVRRGLQNPNRRPAQYALKIHMRFPCPCGEGSGVGVNLHGRLKQNRRKAARHDRPRRTDSEGYPDRAARRRRRADRRAVLSHRGGLDAFRGRTGSRTADAARSRNSLARRAARKPAHPRPAVHGRSRGWFAGSDRDEPDAAGTDVRRQGAGALAGRRIAACYRHPGTGAVVESRCNINCSRRADAAGGYAGADIYRHDRRGTGRDAAPRRTVAGRAGAAAIDSRADIRRRGLASRHNRTTVVRYSVFDPVRAVAGQFRDRTVRGRRKPAPRPGLSTELTPINSHGGEMKQTTRHCLPPSLRLSGMP